VEEAIKKMRDKKATRDDDVPGDVLILFGEYGLRLMTQLIKLVKCYIWSIGLCGAETWTLWKLGNGKAIPIQAWTGP
jgi:hypothetical protein